MEYFMIAGFSIVFFAVLILGIIGDVFAIVQKATANQTFWMFNAYWVTALALLHH